MIRISILVTTLGSAGEKKLIKKVAAVLKLVTELNKDALHCTRKYIHCRHVTPKLFIFF